MIYRIKQIIYDYKFKLHAAARDGDVDAVKKYLASGWDVNQRSTLWERTPLHCATNLEIVKLLIDHNADLDAKDSNRQTRLHYLCLHTYLPYREYEKEEIELLISKGANVNASTHYNETTMGETPLDCVKHNKEIADILRKHGAKKMVDIYLDPNDPRRNNWVDLHEKHMKEIGPSPKYKGIFWLL